MSEQITIELPDEPGGLFVSDRGLKYYRPGDIDIHERSFAEYARLSVEINDEAMDVAEVEELALALLWMVRNHYNNPDGLQCEVTR